MQDADPGNYPFDLSGVSIVTPDGDGSMAEFGRFFVSIDLPTFAFHDKKSKRPESEEKALAQAGFEIRHEIPYEGMERLLAAEIPIGLQWAYLESVRAAGINVSTAIPTDRPSEDKIRELTFTVLKDTKGWGRAAELIELCAASELPKSISEFLVKLYARFPRPQSKPFEPSDKSDPADPEGVAASGTRADETDIL